MNWCILIPALVGIISAILGYLLGRLLGGGSNNDDCEDRLARLQAELDACRTSKMSLEGDLKSAKSNIASSFAGTAAATVIAFNADVAKAAFGKKIKENDLTVVEGIGPKIQDLFHSHDVKTWSALANTSVERCQEVLNSGGKRFEIHNPKTWPMQSEMAASGKWSELKKWQDEHDYGKA